MNNSSSNIVNEQNAADAFTKQSAIFDELYSSNIIIQYKRARVRNHIEKYLPPSSNILELNAGTGEDAIYFAGQNHSVHATDISTGMQLNLKEKVRAAGLNKLITTEICSFTQLEQLENKGPYDLIFSNFAGLNCTHQLNKVISSFSSLLKPGGFVTLVIMPGFCLWETLLAFRGNFKTAFRRFKSKNGTSANVEGVKFLCWYYRPSYIINCLKKDFKVLSVEGLCTIVPPSYFENFPRKHVRLYNRLVLLENKFKGTWPWKYMGDYFIISLQKN